MKKEITIKLIDKEALIESINYQSHIGGEERLLSRTEVIALIENSHIYDEKKIMCI